MPETGSRSPEPSPTVEAVADEPPAPVEIPRPAAAPHATADDVAPAAPAPQPVKAPSWLDEPLPIRGGIRCASCGRWIEKAASRSAPTNSPA